MLKLVNGREITDEIKEKFKRGLVKSYIKLEDGQIFSSNNYLKSIKLEDFRYNEETDNIIGEAIARRVTLNLSNKGNKFNLENKEFELFIGAKTDFPYNNIYDVNDILFKNEEISIDDEGWVSVNYNNTDEIKSVYLNLFSRVSYMLSTNTTYYLYLEIAEVSGTGGIYPTDSVTEKEEFSKLKSGDIIKYTIRTKNDFEDSNTILKTYIKFLPKENGSIKFRISLIDKNIDINEFEYKKFNTQTDYINFGNFIVQKPDNDDTKETIEFEALDYMVKLNQPFVFRLPLPCTYGDLAEDVCNQCGLELGNKNFRNSNKLIEVNPFINNEQCRFVIKQIAKIAFSWARINIDNKLYFDFVNKSNSESIETFSLDNYINLEKNNETIPINTIVLKNSNIDTENVTIRNQALIDAYGTERKLIVSEDYFAYNQQIRQDLIVAAEELYGLVYNPIKIKSIGTIYLESNDLIDIKDKKNNSLYSYCFNHTIDYNGVLFDEIESPAMTDTEIKYLHEPDENLDKRRTEIEIDKANQRITAISESVSEQEQKIAQLELTTDKIEASVSLVADLTNTVSGIQKIELPNAKNGNLNKLRISGNNSVLGGKLLTEREEVLLNLQLISYSNNKQPYTKYIYNHNAQGFVPTNVLIYSIKPNTTYTVNLKNIVDYGRNEITVGTFDKYLPDITETTTLNNFISNFSYKYNEDSDSYYWDMESNKYWYTIKSGENDSYLYITYKNESFKSNLEVWESISKLLVTSADLKEKFKIEHVKAYLGYYYTYQDDTVTSYTPKIYPTTDTKRFYILELEVGKTYNIFLDENEISDSLWLYIATFKENPFKSEVTEEIDGIKYYGIRRTKKNDSGDWVGYTNLEEKHITITASEDEKYLIFYPSSNSTFDTANIYDYYREIKLNYGIALKQSGDIYDEYVIEDDVSKVIHRLGTNENGELYELADEYVEVLGEFPIELTNGDNILTLSESANLSVNYIIINDLTKNFTSSTEFKSTIELLYNSILLQVSQKVGDEEIIAKLNLAIKDGEGIIDILGNKIKIKSDYFELTENGIIKATGGTIAGFTIGDKVLESDLVGMAQGEQKAFWVRQVKGGEDIFLVTMSGDLKCKTILVDGNPLVRTTPQAGREIRNLYIDGNQLVAITSDGLYIILPDSVPSDKRLKTDIKDTNIKALPIIDKMNFKNFNWKDTGKNEKLGLIADDLQSISKDLVSEVKGGKFKKTKVVNKSKMIYYNSKAIQELNNIIKKYEEKIADLESRIKYLETN